MKDGAYLIFIGIIFFGILAILGPILAPILGGVLAIGIMVGIPYLFICALFDKPEVRVATCYKCKRTVTSKMKRCKHCGWNICEHCRSCGCNWKGRGPGAMSRDPFDY